MKKLLKLLEISAIVLFCAMSCTMSANAQGIGGKAGTGGKGGFGGGSAVGGSISFITSTYVAQTSSATASITSPAVSLTAGQSVFVYCRTGDSSISISFSSTPSNTFGTPLTSQTGSVGSAQLGYAFNVAGGSTTFTCTPSTTENFQSMIVLVYSSSPAFSGLDAQTGSTSGAGSGSTFTSSSFTTTTPGLIITCATAASTAIGWNAGNIGGVLATVRQVSASTVGSAADSACEDIITSSAQTTITGAISWTVGFSWVGSVGAFH